jgi:hypothetical protein
MKNGAERFRKGGSRMKKTIAMVLVGIVGFAAVLVTRALNKEY